MPPNICCCPFKSLYLESNWVSRLSFMFPIPMSFVLPSVPPSLRPEGQSERSDQEKPRKAERSRGIRRSSRPENNSGLTFPSARVCSQSSDVTLFTLTWSNLLLPPRHAELLMEARMDNDEKTEQPSEAALNKKNTEPSLINTKHRSAPLNFIHDPSTSSTNSMFREITFSTFKGLKLVLLLL